MSKRRPISELQDVERPDGVFVLVCADKDNPDDLDPSAWYPLRFDGTTWRSYSERFSHLKPQGDWPNGEFVVVPDELWRRDIP